jgi:ABC-type transport system substrate-binding protein
MTASGYKGQTAVVLSAADQSIVALQATVATERMKQAGIKIDFQTLDTSTIRSRRTRASRWS